MGALLRRQCQSMEIDTRPICYRRGDVARERHIAGPYGQASAQGLRDIPNTALGHGAILHAEMDPDIKRSVDRLETADNSALIEIANLLLRGGISNDSTLARDLHAGVLQPRQLGSKSRRSLSHH